jgi:hypothetical protein
MIFSKIRGNKTLYYENKLIITESLYFLQHLKNQNFNFRTYHIICSKYFENAINHYLMAINFLQKYIL